MTVADKVQIAQVIVAALGALLVFVGGFRTYAYQKKVDRAERLREKKQESYQRYLEALYSAAMERNRDASISEARAAQGLVLPPDELFANEAAHDRFQAAKLTVFVMASDDVIRAAGEHQKLLETSGNSGASRREAFAKLIRAMRADSFEASDLSVNEIADLSPINHH